MSISICSRCLARLRLSNQYPIVSTTIQSSSFHTSSPQHASPLKKKANTTSGTQIFAKRESRSAKIKKGTRQRPVLPAVGEIRTQRKRIVLSNTNAPEIRNMEDLSASNMAVEGNAGRVLGLPGPLLDQLREAKAFKTSQNWSLFRRPATLVRDETVTIAGDVQAINDSSASDQTITRRKIIVGDKQCGKSILLLQAMSTAFLNNWVVISIPEAQDFVINQSSYVPAPKPGTDSTEQLYFQPNLTAELLSRIASANATVLAKFKPRHDHSKSTVPILESNTLKQLAEQGASDPKNAWPIWEALWKELTVPVKGRTFDRPPLLVTIDGIHHWMRMSKYRAADYSLIHSHQLLLVRHFVSLLFSQPSASLPQRGMVLATSGGGNAPNTPVWDLVIRQIQAAKAGMSLPQLAPYTTPDAQVMGLATDEASMPDILQLAGLSKAELKGLLGYFARSGLFQGTVDEITVAEKWTLSGSGNVGDLVKIGARLRI